MQNAKLQLKIQKCKYFLSLILPVFNEEESVESAVRKSYEELKKNFDKFEIIVVNDGSIDNTGKILSRLKKNIKELRVFENSVNLGQGLSLLIGFKKASGDLVLHNGVDMPFDLNYLAKFIKYFPEYDIVVVERLDRSAYSWWRKFTSVANNILRWIFLSKKYRDLNFVQIYKRGVVKNIKVHAKGATMVTTELIIRAESQGYKIARVKAPYMRRRAGVASHGQSHDILIAAAEMLNFWLNKNKKLI